MYWYNPLKKTIIYLIAGFVLSLAINSCKSDNHSVTDNKRFFDIKGYFKTDSARLSKLNPLVYKTVVHNGITETKKVHVLNWGSELSLFSESDINKPAWKTSYIMQTTDDFLIYIAKDHTLKTQRIVIKKEGERLKWIMIDNHTKNILHESFEKLTYFPDSLYLIQKKQRVRVLGTDIYRISGSLINDVR